MAGARGPRRGALMGLGLAPQRCSVELLLRSSSEPWSGRPQRADREGVDVGVKQIRNHLQKVGAEKIGRCSNQ